MGTVGKVRRLAHSVVRRVGAGAARRLEPGQDAPSPRRRRAAAVPGQPASPHPQRPGPHVRRLEREVAQLKQRIALLEAELQESRQLSKRVAEITDVVAEVLLPAEQRDEERLRAVLDEYDSSL